MTLNSWSSSEISLWWSCSTDLPRTLSSNTVALPNSSSVSGISPSHFATLNFPYSWAPAITVIVITFRRLLMSVRWAKNNTVRGLYLTSIYIQLHTALSVWKPKCLNYIILFFYWMRFFFTIFFNTGVLVKISFRNCLKKALYLSLWRISLLNKEF